MKIVTNHLVEAYTKAEINFVSDAIYAALYNPSASFDSTSENYSTTYEIVTGNGYTRLGHSLSNAALSISDSQLVFNADDLDFKASGKDIGPVKYLALVHGNTSKYLVVFDFEKNINLVDGTTTTAIFNSSGILRIRQV